MSENFKIIFMLDAIYTVFHKKNVAVHSL